ncbi:MAG: hypothetical protein IPH12_17790 [Saprospirales bacterium]|nr:hypothetical protein [Saprospirales bacterium]
MVPDRYTKLYYIILVFALIYLWLVSGDLFELGQRLVYTGILIGFWTIFAWLDTIRVCGLGCLISIPLMYRIFWTSKRGSLLIGILIFCLLIWFNPLAANLSPYRFIMAGTFVFSITLFWFQPPFALMLGESSPEIRVPLKTISGFLNPLRIVGFFDGMREINGAFSPFTDNLRTESFRDWEKVIDTLINLVPLIVLDARGTSKIVAFEVFLINRSPRGLKKSIFIVNPDGTAPALYVNGLSIHTPGLQGIFEKDLSNQLKRHCDLFHTNF